MPDGTNNIWVDASFSSPEDSDKDVDVELQLADSDNIGDYSIPAVYRTGCSSESGVDTFAKYFSQPNATSGVKNISKEYFIYTPPLISGVDVSLVEYISGEKDLVLNIDTESKYSTGFTSISGGIDRVVAYTEGKEYLNVADTSAYYVRSSSVSGVEDKYNSYTNFSGNVTTSGIAIPTYNVGSDKIAEYMAPHSLSSGILSNIVDISFAGWVPFVFHVDAYSVDHNMLKGYTGEIITTSGTVFPNYIDVTSSDLRIVGKTADIYCSLVDFAALQVEAETGLGRVAFVNHEVYSTINARKSLMLDIGLLSIKVSNFSLDEGEFTSASGAISVDITDDVYPVSISGTYFAVDGIRVPVTFSGISDGYRMYYTPSEGFGYIDGPTTFTAHAENECNDVLEQDFYLTFGYIVEYLNNPDVGIDYGPGHKVAVRVNAENHASCPQESSLAWDFTSKALSNSDLTASITGKLFSTEHSEISAEIYPTSTAYFYGKEVNIVIKAKDFAGNKMDDFILSYTIQDKPGD